ncbi:MAG: 30S ribosomal protein S6 [Candidatus Pacebacteria bacterium]|jgi:ribosomal protein S6|nr:hypothetical protein [bacterium]MDP6527403.1 30S ribosomal protein S6 [Candidatus Paceibacterota bacterium]MDP6659529.1 30S ribosomal protein S6 [Candidatus Paceibacterota bacterium]|tara:strand:- start:19382 stop:19891 length:510 start_codon:yes stop_codon:yes gene_type:complete
MAEDKDQGRENDNGAEPRIYELGYLIIPTIKDDETEEETAKLKSSIESVGGTFLSEEIAKDTALSYTMRKGHGGKYEKFDHAYFGSIKFEADPEKATALDIELKKDDNLLRYIIIKTVRENTRATVRIAPQLDTVATSTKRQPVKRVEEKSGPVSEEELNKSIEELVVE